MKRMLLVIAGFIAGYSLTAVHAQHDVFVSNLTLRDAIEVLADYEVMHPQVPARSEWYGWTDPDEQRIFTIRNADLATRRETVIHELTHVTRRYNGLTFDDKQSEEIATSLSARAVYLELFGAIQENGAK